MDEELMKVRKRLSNTFQSGVQHVGFKMAKMTLATRSSQFA